MVEKRYKKFENKELELSKKEIKEIFSFLNCQIIKPERK